MPNTAYPKDFLHGITKLTGIPIRKLERYAKEQDAFNILEHPKTISPNDKQLEKITQLNEFITQYNGLKLYSEQNKMRFGNSDEAGNYFVSQLQGLKNRERFMAAFLDAGNNVIECLEPKT